MPLLVFVMLILGVAIAVVAIIIYLIQPSTGDESGTESLHSEEPYEPELPPVKAGDRILYGYSGPNDECPLYFIVASVDHDNSEVYGDFRIVLPVGAKAGEVDFDRDSWVVTAEYTIGDTTVDLRYDVEHDPEELADYSVIIDSTTSGPESV